MMARVRASGGYVAVCCATDEGCPSTSPRCSNQLVLATAAKLLALEWSEFQKRDMV